MPLNARQQRFAEEYVANGGNATAAAKVAGYSIKTAYSNGSRLLTHAEVQKYVDDLRSKTTAKIEVTAERLIALWAGWAFDPKTPHPQATKASAFLAQTLGLLTNKVEVTSDSLSDEERAKRVAALMTKANEGDKP
jgi:phage terminase small subunit